METKYWEFIELMSKVGRTAINEERSSEFTEDNEEYVMEVIEYFKNNIETLHQNIYEIEILANKHFNKETYQNTK
jgi:uncharacterized protein YgfB (UPF0149 family)